MADSTERWFGEERSIALWRAGSPGCAVGVMTEEHSLKEVSPKPLAWKGKGLNFISSWN